MDKNDEMNIKARELLDKLYTDEDVDRNLEAFCALLRPVIWKRARQFISNMEGYDKDDFFQEAYILIWQIALQKKPAIQGSVVAYFSRAIWYGFINLYYQYALKNAQRIYAGTDLRSPSLSYFRLKEIDYVEKRKKRARESARKSYIKRYTEKHGYPPDQKPPKPVLSDKERRAKQPKPRIIGRPRKWGNNYFVKQARKKAQKRKYYAANRERIIEASKVYYSKHREEISAANKEYYNAYHDYLRLKVKRRREEEAYLEWRDKKREKLTTEKKPQNNARQRIWQRAYRATHSREEEIIKAREQYVEHRDEITAKRRAERQNDPEGVRAKQRAYRLKHKNTINAQRRDYYQDHKEKFSEWNHEYYTAHLEECRERNRQYRSAHAEECNERSRQYRKEHKEEINQKKRQKIAEERELSKTDPEVATKREERLAKQREYNRRYREKKRAEREIAREAAADVLADDGQDTQIP